MIRCHLARLMGEHKMKIVDVAAQDRFKPEHGDAAVQGDGSAHRTRRLDKLCKLFDCQISDLLEFIPD